MWLKKGEKKKKKDCGELPEIVDVGNVYWVGKDEGLFALQTSVVSTSPGIPTPPAPGLGVGGVFLVLVFLTDEGEEGDLQPLWSSLISAQHPALGVLRGKSLVVWKHLGEVAFLPSHSEMWINWLLRKGQRYKLSKTHLAGFSSECFRGLWCVIWEKHWDPLKFLLDGFFF